jgi:hypothetical protein
VKKTPHTIVGQAILDMQAFLLGLDKAGRSQDLKMLRCVGGRDPSMIRQHLDRPRSLAEEVEKLQASWRGKGLSDTREMLVDGVLELSIGGLHEVKYSSNYLICQ